MKGEDELPHPPAIAGVLLLTLPAFLGLVLLAAYPWDTGLAILVAVYAPIAAVYVRYTLKPLRDYGLAVLNDIAVVSAGYSTTAAIRVLRVRLERAWRAWPLVAAGLALPIPHIVLTMLARLHHTCLLSSQILTGFDRLVKPPPKTMLYRAALALSILVLPGAVATALYYKRLRSCMMVARAVIDDILQEGGGSRPSSGSPAGNIHSPTCREHRRDTTHPSEDVDSRGQHYPRNTIGEARAGSEGEVQPEEHPR